MFEVERKFLLKNLPDNLKNHFVDCFKITHLFSLEDGTRYTRKQYLPSNEVKYIKNIKTPTSLTYTNYEKEEELTYEEFYTIINGLIAAGEDLKQIVKVRYTRYDELGNLWEIHLFENINMVLAEVEIMVQDFQDLNLINQVETPQFIQDVLIMEVSHLKEFSNKNLAI